jgi:gamma-carbonic anhydrase
VLWAKTPIATDHFVPGAGIDAYVGGTAYVAPTASVAGSVRLSPDSSVWFGVLLEGEIEIGEGSNVQDNSWLRGNVRIGRLTTIGHNVRMSSCVIGDNAMIGMGSIIGEATVVQNGGCVAAGAVTEPGTVVESGWIWSGRPARKQREIGDRNREGFARGVQVYITYTKNYLKTAEQLAIRQTGP